MVQGNVTEIHEIVGNITKQVFCLFLVLVFMGPVIYDPLRVALRTSRKQLAVGQE